MSGAHRLGKYEIQAPLGKGPHGTVYRALDTQFDRLVAVKVLPREALEPRAAEAFTKYAQTLVRLRHPGIARFIEVVETSKAMCLVWELVEGRPLASLLLDGARPEPRQAWEIARQMLEALAYAHLQGGVHRDLKPSNVMLAPAGHVTITDFGTAMLLASPGEAVHYRAPEHFDGGKLTPASDLYQVAAIVYHMVTGRPPFSGTAQELAQRVPRERPADPSSHDNRLAWQLDWVLQKALSKNPAERYRSAVEFAEGLRLGLQDTIGVPLAPANPPKSVAAAAAAPAPASLVQNARAIAERKPSAAATPAASSATVTSTAPATPAAPAAPAAVPAAPAAVPAAPAAGSTAPAAVPAAKAEPPAPVRRPLTPAASPAAPSPPPANAVPSPPPQPAPAAPGPSAQAAAAPASARSGRPRVLFVDDDARLLNGLRTTFRHDYEVLTAENGDAALALITSSPVHVVVSDQRMPGLTGVELLRKVRGASPNTVRILLTGYTDLAALVGSINEGEIFRFVKKPWDNDELKKALADASKIAMELAATPAPKATSPRTAGSILVIDRGQAIARGLERLIAGAARVRLVATPAEAAKALADHDIAAVVADMGAGMDGLVALFRDLKARRPEVLSILLTDQPDSELAIELVNRAQVFRFLPKPVNARELRSHVATALRRYAAFKQIPTLREALPGTGPSAGAVAERARALPPRPLAPTT